MEGLVHLQTLDLSDNVIQEIPVSHRGLHRYKANSRDSFSSTQGRVSIKHYFRSRCSALKTLVLHKNRIALIGDHAFSECFSLNLIDLSNNELKSLRPGSFRGLYELKSLNLNQNNLDLLPETYPANVFADLAKLESLDILGNYKPYGSLAWPGLRSREPNRFISSGINRLDARDYPDVALSFLVTLKVLRIDGLHDALPGLGFRALSNLTVLDFTGSSVLNRLPENFFSNFSTRKPLSLILTGCRLTSIHPDSFAYLPFLDRLNLRDNDDLEFSGFEIASRSLYKTQIKSIDISRIHRNSLIVLQGEYFRNLRNLGLEELKFDYNEISMINASVDAYLPHAIRTLSLENNKLQEIDFLFGLVRLQHLEEFNCSVQNRYHRSEDFPTPYEHSKGMPLSSSSTKVNLTSAAGDSHYSNWIRILPLEYSQETQSVSEDFLGKLKRAFCPPNGVYSPKPLNQPPRMVKVSKAMISMLGKENSTLVALDAKGIVSNLKGGIPLPQNLKRVYASQLKLGMAVPEIEVQAPNVVEFLDLSRNFLWCLGGPMKGFDMLQTLNLSGNYFFMLSTNFFDELSSLKTLLLKNNLVGPSLEADHEGKIFAKLIALETLDLSQSGLRKLHHSVFSSNTKVTELLLGSNALRTFSTNISHMRNLSFLDLSSNDITTLPKPTLASLDVIAFNQPSISVDLSVNPLICDCSTLDFLRWIKTTRVNLKNIECYRCTYLNGSSVLLTDVVSTLMTHLERFCSGPEVFPGVLLCFFVFVSLLTSFAVYSYISSRLLFLIYISKRRYFRTFNEPQQHGIKDVFLVFDDEHRVWRNFVARVLRPALESRGVSLFITQAHALAGRPKRLVVEESVLSGTSFFVPFVSF